jgi:hypothetical protein
MSQTIAHHIISAQQSLFCCVMFFIKIEKQTEHIKSSYLVRFSSTALEAVQIRFTLTKQFFSSVP